MNQLTKSKEVELSFLDGIHIDISKIEHTLETDKFLNSIKGNCNCSIFSCPEHCFCLEMHTPRKPLLAKLSQYKNHRYNYDCLYYGEISN